MNPYGSNPLAPQASASASSATFALLRGISPSRSRLPGVSPDPRTIRGGLAKSRGCAAAPLFRRLGSLARPQMAQDREDLAHLEGLAHPGGHHARGAGSGISAAEPEMSTSRAVGASLAHPLQGSRRCPWRWATSRAAPRRTSALRRPTRARSKCAPRRPPRRGARARSRAARSPHRRPRAGARGLPSSEELGNDDERGGGRRSAERPRDLETRAARTVPEVEASAELRAEPCMHRARRRRRPCAWRRRHRRSSRADRERSPAPRRRPARLANVSEANVSTVIVEPRGDMAIALSSRFVSTWNSTGALRAMHPRPPRLAGTAISILRRAASRSTPVIASRKPPRDRPLRRAARSRRRWRGAPDCARTSRATRRYPIARRDASVGGRSSFAASSHPSTTVSALETSCKAPPRSRSALCGSRSSPPAASNSGRCPADTCAD